MNLGDLFSKALGGASLISDLIMVSPSDSLGIIPSNKDPNKKGFLFHIIGDESVTLNTDITDHFVENNSSLQDHIALRPESVKLSGYIGELNNVLPDILQPAKIALDRLNLISGYVPNLTSTALRLFNAAEQLYRVAEKAKTTAQNLATGINNIPEDQMTEEQKKARMTKQQQAFNEFYNHFLNRQLFYVQTPYAMFTNMAIQSMTVTQADGDKNKSDFEISFKKIRFAETLLNTKKTSKKMQGKQANQGTHVPKKV